MNLLKIIIFYGFLVSSCHCYTQEAASQTDLGNTTDVVLPTTTQIAPEQTTQAATVAIPEQNAQNIQENVPAASAEIEKDEMGLWKKHVESLTPKGAHWDESANTIETAWQSEAVTLAEAVLKKDISLADELKSSFLNTIKDKFTNVEKSSNLEGAFSIIDNFKNKIDEIVKNLTPEAKNNAAMENNDSSSKKLISEPNQEPLFSAPTEATIEGIEGTKEEGETTDTGQDKAAEKQKQKQESRWQETLHNIKTEGTDETEVKEIINEAITIATNIAESITDTTEQTDKINTLKSDFAQAVQERSENIPPVKSLYVSLFNNKLDALVQPIATTEELPFFSMPEYEQDQEMLSTMYQKPQIPTEPPKKDIFSAFAQTAQQQNQKPQQAEQPIQSTGSSAQPAAQTITVTTTTTTTTPEIGLPQQQSRITEQEALRKTKENQDLLAKKIQMAAAQKVAAEKEESKKGIVSSVMNAIFGKEPSAAEKTLHDIRKEQDNLLETMIAKFKLDDKTLIKTAYHNFQDKMLSFDINKVWDTQQDKPKDELWKWIKKVESSLKVLIKFNIMNVESITIALQEALKAHTKMPVACYTTIIDKSIIPSLKQYVAQLEEEKAEIQRREIEERKKQQQELVEREKRAQLRAQQEEQEKKDIVEKQLIEKDNAKKDLESLKVQWRQLMQQIATNKPASNESNNEYTKKALEITQKMFEKSVLLPEENRQAMVATHIATLSNALLEQASNNESINVHPYIEIFNKEIHKL